MRPQLFIAAVLSFISTVGLANSAQAQGLQGPARAAAISALDGEQRRNLLQDASRIFYGDFNGDGQRDAIAFLYYGFEGGNGTGLEVILFEQQGNSFRLLSRPKIFGNNPRNVRFRPGSIRLVTTTLKPGEPRCCPTDVREWTIEVGENSTSPQPLPPRVADNGGTLARRWCSEGGYVEYRNGTLFLEVSGNEAVYRGVEFRGCDGMRCTYTQGSARWVSSRRGNTMTLVGPMPSSGGNRLSAANSTPMFGVCR
jgi:hypothetical protein